MSEIQPVLKEFLKTVDASISETIATSEVQGVTEYERGVKDGALGLADQLHAEGYVITDKEGTVVKPEPAVGDEPALTFSQTYLTTAWADVNT